MHTDDELQALRCEKTALQEGLRKALGIIEQLQQQVTDLQEQVAQLQQQGSKDSHNSSLPPSSDRFVRQPKSLRKPSGKKKGAQRGHQGHHLSFSDHPDQVQRHQVGSCQFCQQDLHETSASIVERRQVVELPVKRLLVTEHQIEEKQCPRCWHMTRASFPVQLHAPVQYGSSIQALAIYLVEYQLLPYVRAAQVLSDLLGVQVSTGSIVSFVEQCSTHLEPIEKQIKAALIQSEVIHQDETGVYVNGKCFWMHVCSTKRLTHYAVHPKRSTEALDAIGISPNFHGISVHDGWPMYHRYFHQHALCNVHHLRELTFVEEELKQPWARRMKDVLLEMKEAVEQAGERGKSSLDPFSLALLRARYREILEEGEQANPPDPPPKKPKKGKPKRSPTQNLLHRLCVYQQEVLLFLENFAVDFDNNLAERDVRMAKVQQKISGCFRSEKGAVAFARIRGYLSTMHKQGHAVLNALEHILADDPVLPAFS